MILIESKVAPRAKGYGSVQHLSDVISTNKSVGDIYYMGLALKKLHNRRLPKALETKLLQKPRLALDYCRRVLKRRWPELEVILMMGNDSILQLKYYVRIAKGVRAPKNLEDQWAKSFIGLYSNGNWGMVEPSYGLHYRESRIPDDGMLYIQYARNNIKGRWSALEKSLMALYYANVTKYTEQYIKHIIKGQWIELENFIVEKETPEYSLQLLESYIKFLESIGIKYQYNNGKVVTLISLNTF